MSKLFKDLVIVGFASHNIEIDLSVIYLQPDNVSALILESNLTP